MLDPVSPGQPLEIAAADWNALIAGELDRRRARGAGPSAPPAALPLTPATLALFKYDASAKFVLPFGSVVRYGEPLVSVSDHPYANGRRPAFLLATPTAATNQVAVTVEPIAGGTLGRAVTSGLAVCTVDVSDATHTRAVPINGDSTKFASAAGGGYPVVWKQGGTGDKWAVVLVGPAAPTSDPAAWSVEGDEYDVTSGTITPANEPSTYMYLELAAGKYLVLGTGVFSKATSCSAYVGIQVWDAGDTRPTTGTMVGGQFLSVPTTSGVGISMPFVVSAALDLSADSWVAIGYKISTGSPSVNSSHLSAIRVGEITPGGYV